MLSFERQYYESDDFWNNNMVQDEANKKRIHLTTEFVPTDVKSLADIGCGNGVFLNYLATMRPDVRSLGVDRSSAALKFVSTEKLEGSIENLPLPSDAFDCITCLEVIEHLPEGVYQKGISELARLSKKYIILSVPYKEKLEESYTKCPACKSIFNYELHLRTFDEEVLKNIFLPHGFEQVKMITTGTDTQYWGHNFYRKIFYPEQFLKWNSPICPICGYSDQVLEKKAIAGPGSVDKTRSKKIVSYLSSIPKLFWPTVTKDYWIITLYEKKLA